MRSINVSGHEYGLAYTGIGSLVSREPADLAEVDRKGGTTLVERHQTKVGSGY